MALKGLGRVLVLNAGSSSLKFKLFDLAPALASTVGGMIDRIGDTANSALIAKQSTSNGITKYKDQVSLRRVDAVALVVEGRLFDVATSGLVLCLLHTRNQPTKQVPISDHVSAMKTVMDFLSKHVSSSIMHEVVAVGHRWGERRWVRVCACVPCVPVLYCSRRLVSSWTSCNAANNHRQRSRAVPL